MPDEIPTGGAAPSTILPPYRFAGTGGHLEYADGRSIPCDFEISQDVAGTVSLVCEHDQAGLVMAEALGDRSPCRFRAETPDGLMLVAEGNFLQEHDLPDSPVQSRAVQVRYDINGPGVRFTSRDDEGGTLNVRFSVLNLVFSGSLITRYESDDRGVVATRDVLPLMLGSREVALRQVPDFTNVVKNLRIRRSSRVTAILSATVGQRDQLDSLVEDVTRLCALLTLATGAKVNWAAYEARTESGTLKAGMQRSAVVRPLSTFDLIHPQDSNALINFVQSTFPIYRSLETDYELGRVIDARVDASAGAFLETRTLIALVLTDYLTRRYAQLHQHKVRSFAERLRFMVKNVCADYDRKDIGTLIKSRDSLVHDMRFLTADKTGEYMSAMHLVNRLVLGLLRYVGPYADCRTWTMVTPGSPSTS